MVKRQVAPALRVPGLVSYDSAASHTGLYLRDIAWRRKNAAGALER